MKKLLCVFMMFIILSSCICVSANSNLYTCKPRINGYIQDDVLVFDFELSDNMPNEKFLIAAYRENKLENAVFYTVDKIRQINAQNITNESDENIRRVVNIKFKITPDIVKIFALNGHIIPVCEETVFFETTDDIIAINQPVVTQLENGVKLFSDNKALFKGKEKVIVNTLILLAKDAAAKNKEFLLTREFALRNYKTQLDEIIDLYNSMSESEQSIFQNHIFTDIRDDGSIDYLIKYLGLNKYITK